GELDRVVADDLAQRHPIGCGPLPEVGEVAEHRQKGVAIGNAPVVHEVPVERLGGGAVRFGEGLDAGPVQLVLLLLLERPGKGFDPLGGHGYFSPSSCWCSMWWYSCSIRSARKLQALQNSSRSARPLALSA